MSTSRKNHIEPAKAIPLGTLVEVAPNAIVSREIARTAGGTMTVFGFDAGQGLSEHTAPFDAMVQVVDGCLELTIGGEDIIADRGTLVLMPAHVPHALHAPERATMLLTMLREPADGGNHASS
jgi:quercetin dioxygenase-like cupin family protein